MFVIRVILILFVIQMTHLEKLRLAQSEIRDVINWVKVFEEEYNLEKEVVDTLCNRLRKIAEDIAKIVE